MNNSMRVLGGLILTGALFSAAAVEPPGSLERNRALANLVDPQPEVRHAAIVKLGQVGLAAAPPLLLLDEPTRGLDYASKTRLTELLRELAATSHTVLLAPHDVELAAELAHRTIVIADGEVVADGPSREVVTQSPSFAPQVAKILAPQPWLTVLDVRRALADTA